MRTNFVTNHINCCIPCIIHTIHFMHDNHHQTLRIRNAPIIHYMYNYNARYTLCLSQTYIKNRKQDTGAHKEEHPIHLLNLIPSQTSLF